MKILAEMMAALPEPEYKPWPDWNHWRNRLWHDAQRESAQTLYTWGVVRHCMLSGWLPVAVAWEQVRDNLDRYGPVMEPVGGLPVFEGHDRNLVRLVGWLALWERWSGQRVEDLARIIEIGGGFGGLCVAVVRLGFRGEYSIVDLPEVAVLQDWFLAQYGIQVSRRQEGPCDLLIAYSSLSEIPPDERGPLAEVARASSCLFEYGPRYNRWDNMAWFAELRESWPGQWVQIMNNDMPIEAWW